MTVARYDNFDIIIILTGLGGLGKEIKRNRIEDEGR